MWYLNIVNTMQAMRSYEEWVGEMRQICANAFLLNPTRRAPRLNRQMSPTVLNLYPQRMRFQQPSSLTETPAPLLL